MTEIMLKSKKKEFENNNNTINMDENVNEDHVAGFILNEFDSTHFFFIPFI